MRVYTASPSCRRGGAAVGEPQPETSCPAPLLPWHELPCIPAPLASPLRQVGTIPNRMPLRTRSVLMSMPAAAAAHSLAHLSGSEGHGEGRQWWGQGARGCLHHMHRDCDGSPAMSQLASPKLGSRSLRMSVLQRGGAQQAWVGASLQQSSSAGSRVPSCDPVGTHLEP